MDLEEACAVSDGIDFHIPKSNLVISARRNEEEQIVISKHPKREKNERPLQTLQGMILVILYALLLSISINYIESAKIRTIVVLFAMWAGVFVYYFLKSKRKEDFASFRYHAAEHKALNYLDRYNEAPSEVSFLMNTSSYSVRCGSTMIAVLCTIITLVTLSVVFLPWIWLKVIGCILSFVVVFLLWAFDFLNFFQKFVIREPTWDEVEVAYEGLKEYVKERKHEEIR